MRKNSKMDYKMAEISRVEGEFLKTNAFTKRNQWYELKKMVEQGLATRVKRAKNTLACIPSCKTFLLDR